MQPSRDCTLTGKHLPEDATIQITVILRVCVALGSSVALSATCLYQLCWWLPHDPVSP